MLGLVCLVLLATTCRAIQIQSTFINTFIAPGSLGNDTEWQQNTLTGHASSADFRSPGLQIGAFFWDINALDPKAQFSTVLREFVPYKRHRYTAEVCDVQLVRDFPEDTSPPQNTGTGRRRLLEADSTTVTQGRGKERRVVRTQQHERKLMTFLDDILEDVPVIGHPLRCAAAQVSYGILATSCNNNPAGNTQDQINDLKKEISVLQDTAVFVNSSLKQFDGIQQFNKDVAGQLGYINDSLHSIQDEVVTTHNALNLVAQKADQQYNETQIQFAAVSSSIQAGIDFSIAITLRQQQFENATFRNILAINNASRVFAANVNEDVRRLQSEDRANRKYTRRLAGLFNRNIQEIDLRRAMSQTIWDLIQQAKTDGLTPFLNPSAPGLAPQNPNVAARTVFVDKVLLNFITDDGGPPHPHAHQYGVNFFCSVDTILNNVSPGVTWTDIVELIGPVGCLNLPGNAVDNCGCWLEISHSECRAADTPQVTADFNWQQITTVLDRTAYFLGAVGTTPTDKCKTGNPIVASTDDGTKIDDITVWNALLGRLCFTQLGTTTGTSGTRRFQHVSTRIGVVNFDSPSNPADICGIDIETVFYTDTTVIDMVHLFYQQWINAYSILLSDQQPFEAEVYGILPNFLTYEYLPFQTLPDNNTYACYRASFVAVSPDTRPVFTVEELGIVTTVEATAYDSPPICDNFGCTFGNVVDVQSTSSVAASLTFTNLLPDSSETIVGELRTHGVPAQTTMFNIPAGSAPADDVSYDRDGKITYMWQIIPDAYDISSVTSFTEAVPLSQGGPYPDTTLLDAWQASNSRPFSHIKSGASLNNAEVPLVGGQCSLSADLVAEKPCERLLHWGIDASTDMRQGRLVFEGLDGWDYTFTLNINMGEIVQRVLSGCPQFGYQIYTDGIIELTLLNTLPTPVQVVTRVNNADGDCPVQGDVTFTLLPRLTQVRNIPACGHQSLSVFRIDIGGNLVQCENALNITFDPLAEANVKRFFVDTTNRSFIADEVFARSTELQLDTVNLITQLIPLLIPDLTPTLEAPARFDAINVIIQTYNASLTTLKQVSQLGVGLSATDAIQPLNQQFTDQAAAVQLSFAEENATLTKINADNAANAANLADLHATSDKFQADITASIAAKEKLIADLQNDGNNDPCHWCSNALGILAPFICTWLCPLINAVIGIAEIVLIVGIVYCAVVYCCLPCCKAGIARANQPKTPSAPPMPPQQQPLTVVTQQPQLQTSSAPLQPAAVAGQQPQPALAAGQPSSSGLGAVLSALPFGGNYNGGYNAHGRILIHSDNAGMRETDRLLN